MNQYKKRR